MKNRIEKIKEKYRNQLEKDAQALSASIIRELDYLFRNNKSVSQNDYMKILSQLKIPNSQKNRIIRNLNEAQKKLTKFGTIILLMHLKIATK